MSNSNIDKLNTLATQGLFNDPKAVNAIKQNSDKIEGLKQASAQFETLFLQMVLKSMRSASDALSDEDSLVSSAQTRMYRDMHDGQLTMAMANKGNIGIADAMVKQLSPLVAATVVDHKNHPQSNAKQLSTDAVNTEQLPTSLTTKPDVLLALGQVNEIKTPPTFKSQENMVADKLASHDAFRQSLLTVIKPKNIN